MNRYFDLTEKAQQALAKNPNRVLVVGDKQEAYAIYAADADGRPIYKIIGLRSFHAIKFTIDQLNETGTSDYYRWFKPEAIPVQQPKEPELSEKDKAMLAGPDLLAALQKIVDLKHEAGGSRSYVDQILAIAKAAIAKVKTA